MLVDGVLRAPLGTLAALAGDSIASSAQAGDAASLAAMGRMAALGASPLDIAAAAAAVTPRDPPASPPPAPPAAAAPPPPLPDALTPTTVAAATSTPTTAAATSPPPATTAAPTVIATAPTAAGASPSPPPHTPEPPSAASTASTALPHAPTAPPAEPHAAAATPRRSPRSHRPRLDHMPGRGRECLACGRSPSLCPAAHHRCTSCRTPFALGAVGHEAVTEADPDRPAEVWLPPLRFPPQPAPPLQPPPIQNPYGYPLTWADVHSAHTELVRHASCPLADDRCGYCTESDSDDRPCACQWHDVLIDQLDDARRTCRAWPGPLCGHCWRTSCACGHLFLDLVEADHLCPRDADYRLICPSCSAARPEAVRHPPTGAAPLA